jgi:murein DD-endopeptidase MepM/ murein hydrolase activator NlpD
MKNHLSYILPLLLLFCCGRGDEMKYWRPVFLPGAKSSHILSVNLKRDKALIGTYGGGALLISADILLEPSSKEPTSPSAYKGIEGKNWVLFDTSKGLSWNFILGGDWHGDYIILAMLGDGLNISNDGGETWQRYGFNFFGIEYLYTVDAVIQGNRKLVPTADGLVIFEDSIQAWRAITEKEGLASQYIYDMAVSGDMIALGTLHGFSISRDGGKTWQNHSPNGRMTSDLLPACKTRAVAFRGDFLYAGCDDGLYISSDNGASWSRLGADKLRSEFIHDLIFDNKGRLWIATYKEVASFDPGKQLWELYSKEDGLPDGSINCLGIAEGGVVLAGTHHGLFRLAEGKKPGPKVELPVPTKEFFETEEPVHQWMLRPVAPDEQNDKDQTYLYGSTMGGNFRQHQGNEYNDPEGVPLLAVDDGEIVYTDTSIGHTVLKCDTKVDTTTIYAHYHHQHEIFKKVGDRVNRGDRIGTIGKKGNVTNEHLHFEVAVSARDSARDSISTTRNSELWVQPLPGCGTIVGNLVDRDGNNVPGARIYGITKPVPTETPFSFAETYMGKVHPSEIYGENFVIGDVPEGDYILTYEFSSWKYKVHVEPGKITRVRMQ